MSDRAWWQPPSAILAAAVVVVIALTAGAAGYVAGEQSGRRRLSAVDKGFLQDMIDHHDQAISMASMAAEAAATPEVRGFAREVLIFQRYEMGVMSSWLVEAGTGEGAPDRRAMDWMDVPSSVDDMPGMATEADLRRLRDASGRDVDELFLRLMRSHHLGGVHMAEFAADHAADPRIRNFAARVAEQQRVEANEYAATYQRLGYGELG